MKVNRNTCGDRRPRPSGREKPGGLFATLGQAGRTSVAILREIFDESAYSRFLARHQLTPSRDSYAAFWSEHERGKARRPRCC